MNRILPRLFAALCVLCSVAIAAAKPNLIFILSDDLAQGDLSATMPDKARTLNERLTQLLAGMEAKMLFNRQFTLNLATAERQMHATRLRAGGLSLPHRGSRSDAGPETTENQSTENN